MRDRTLIQYKDIFQSNSSMLLTSLQEFHEMSQADLDDDRLRESLSGISREVASGIDRIQMNLNFLLKNVEWDTFNIAFFGETNAGKSTLIEALTRGDGSFIGDGRKDFTKVRSNSSFDSLQLMDLPGIEGDERKFISEIKRGLEKAHVVFYVIGTNKEPESETLKKISSFLRDQAKVYSIINARGKPSAYRYQKELESESVRTVEKRTREKFQDILGDHYVDNLIINAHLGYISAGTPKREDFIRDQQKLEEVFGCLEKGYEFSNLPKLEQLLSKLSHNSLHEMAISNTYKYMSTVESIMGRILRGKKEFDREIKSMQEKTDEAVCKAELSIERFRENILTSVHLRLDLLKSEIQNTIYESIDCEYSESVTKQMLELKQRTAETEIRQLLDGQLRELHEEIEAIFTELQKRVDLEFQFRGMGSTEFNMKEIVKKLEINARYIMKEVLDVGLSAIGLIAMAINPILLTIGALVTVVRKAWNWFFADKTKRKREAKTEAYKEINKTMKKIKAEITSTLNREMKLLERSMAKHAGGFHQFIHHIKQLSRAMDEKIRDLMISKTDMSRELASFIEGADREFSYYDLKLKQALLIGPPLNNLSIYRLQEINVYETLESFIGGFQVREGYLLIPKNEEFLYRAASALFDDCRQKGISLPIRGVRRLRS